MNFPLSGNLLKDEIKISKDFLEFCLQNNLKISLKNGEFGADIKIQKNRPNNLEMMKMISELYLSGNLYPPRFYKLLEFSEPEKLLRTLKKFLGVDFKKSSELYKEEISTYREQVMMEKYGCKHNFQSETVKDKIKQTMLDRYGVENPSQSEVVKAKKIQTNLERYGVENVAKSKVIQEKIRKTNLERFGFPVALKSQIVKTVSQEKLLQMNEKYRKVFEWKQFLKNGGTFTNEEKSEILLYLRENYCQTAYNRYAIDLGIKQPKVSIPEQLMRDLIKSLGIENVLYNKRFKEMQGLEFDLFLPDFNLAIEVNGVYWHSEQFRGKHYHQRKKLLALSEGFELLMFTDVEILEHFDVCKSLILKSLKKIPEISFKKLKNSTGKFDRSDVERFIKENWFEMNKVENFEVFTKNSEIVLVKTFDTAGNLVQSVESLKFSVDEITENQKHFDLCLSKDFLKSKDLSEPEELIEGYFNGGKLKF